MEIAARLLLYLGALVAIGSPTARRFAGGGWTARESPGAGQRERWAWGAVLVALVLMLWAQLQALDMAPTREMLAIVLGRTAWGRGWSVLALVAAAGLVVSLVRAALWRRLGLGLVLAFVMGGIGHTAADETVWLARTLDGMHVAAVGVWLGALVCLPRDLSTASWERFSALATVAAPLAVATGLGQAWRRVGGLSALVWPAGDYVWLLAGKAALVLIVMGLGAAHRLHVRRRETPSARSVRIELVLGLLVLTVTAVLTGTAPPGE